MIIKKIENRKGRFKITKALMDEMEIKDWNVVFHNVVVYHCGRDYSINPDSIEFFATSPLFDEIKIGDLIPEYRIIEHRKENGRLSIEFEGY